MKKKIFALTDNVIFERFVALLDWFDREPSDLLRVLTYHRVDEPANCRDLAPALLSATPQNFARQMAYVKKHYQPISVHEVLAYYNENKPLPKRAVLVSFDDAYLDFERFAWSILKQYDIPVILFVPSAYPDNPTRQLWWDQLHNALINTTETQVETPIGEFSLEDAGQGLLAYKQLREYVKSLPHSEALPWVQSFCEKLGVPSLPENSILGWEALQKLADEGVTMAAHTQTHPMMNRIDSEQARQEATNSRTDLDEKFGTTVPVFAYPSGQVSDEAVQVLREEGFQLAFTTERGINNLKNANPLLLKRINVGQSTTLPMLRTQLLPSFARLG